MNEISARKIQIVRALCIISIVFIHSTVFTSYTSYVRLFINFNVGTFLFLSGYLTKLKDSYGSTIKKRLFRVIVPYLIWSVVYILVNGQIKNATYLILTGQSNAPFYYLFVYMQLVILLPIFSIFLRNRNIIVRIIPLLITPIYLLWYYIITLNGVIFYFPKSQISFLPWAIYFYLGMMIGNGKLKKLPSLKQIMPVLVAGFAISYFEMNFWNEFGRHDLCDTVIMASYMLTTICYDFIFVQYIEDNKMEAASRAEKILKIIGDASFGIYLIHNLIINACINIFGENINKGIVVIITVISSTIIVTIGVRILPKKVAGYIGFN